MWRPCWPYTYLFSPCTYCKWQLNSAFVTVCKNVLLVQQRPSKNVSSLHVLVFRGIQFPQFGFLLRFVCTVFPRNKEARCRLNVPHPGVSLRSWSFLRTLAEVTNLRDVSHNSQITGFNALLTKTGTGEAGKYFITYADVLVFSDCFLMTQLSHRALQHFTSRWLLPGGTSVRLVQDTVSVLSVFFSTVRSPWKSGKNTIGILWNL